MSHDRFILLYILKKKVCAVARSVRTQQHTRKQRVLSQKNKNMSRSTIINRLQPHAVTIISSTRFRFPAGLSGVLGGTATSYPPFINGNRPLVAMYSTATVVRQQVSSSASLSAGKWYSINGFSKFSSRKDVELCLVDATPLSIDPILDNNMYPTGKWAVLLPSDGSVDRLEQHIKERMNSRVYLNALRDNQIDDLRTASKYGITNRCVRLRNVHREVNIDVLRYFLRDYTLSSESNAIEMLPLTSRLTKNKAIPQFCHFMIRFESASEAERMVQEKCFSVFEGYQIQAHLFL